MIERVRTWIKSYKGRKKAKREQRAASMLIEQIEQALMIELYDWQRLYIITGIWQPPKGRQQGRTLAYMLRLLLDKSQPLPLYNPHCVRVYADNPFIEERLLAPPLYADWFKSELVHTYERLRAAGVETREIIFRKPVVMQHW